LERRIIAPRPEHDVKLLVVFLLNAKQTAKNSSHRGGLMKLNLERRQDMPYVLVNKHSGKIEISAGYAGFWKTLGWAFSSSQDYVLFERFGFSNDEFEDCIITVDEFRFMVAHQRPVGNEGVLTETVSVEYFENIFDAIQHALDTLGINTTESNAFFDKVRA